MVMENQEMVVENSWGKIAKSVGTLHDFRANLENVIVLVDINTTRSLIVGGVNRQSLCTATDR